MMHVLSGPLPALLLKAARDWADRSPVGITWLLGAPASGKSTWLRALAETAPEVHQLELACWLQPLLGNDGQTTGALSLIDSAVVLLRQGHGSRRDAHLVVAATQLPPASLATLDPACERVVLLRPEPTALAAQRMRPVARHLAVELAEIERLDRWHVGFTSQMPRAEILVPPFISNIAATTRRRPIAAVIGPAHCDATVKVAAEAVGEALVDAGFRIVTGGLGGAMEAASRGASRSIRYRPGDIIGVLPTYNANSANPWVDVPIATGLQHARNVIVVGSADVVLVVGGQAGTLSELALAWTLGRPVICVAGTGGWADELAGRALDGRRTDVLHGPYSARDAASAAKQLLSAHRPTGMFE